MFQYRFALLCNRYFILKENELAKNGECLEILTEGPKIISYEGSVEIGVKEGGKDCSSSNEVVGLDSV